VHAARGAFEGDLGVRTAFLGAQCCNLPRETDPQAAPGKTLSGGGGDTAGGGGSDCFSEPIPEQPAAAAPPPTHQAAAPER
jgi:hypothetical protein